MFFLEKLKDLLAQMDKKENKSFLLSKDLYKNTIFNKITDKNLNEKLEFDEDNPLEKIIYQDMLKKYSPQELNEFLFDLFYFDEIKDVNKLKDFAKSFFANLQMIKEYNPALYPVVAGDKNNLDFVAFIKNSLDIENIDIKEYYLNHILKGKDDNIYYIQNYKLKNKAEQIDNLETFLENYSNYEKILEQFNNNDTDKKNNFLNKDSKLGKLFALFTENIELLEENYKHINLLKQIINNSISLKEKGVKLNKKLYDEFDAHITKIEHQTSNLNEKDKEKELFILDNAKAIITDYFDIEPTQTMDILEEYFMYGEKEKQELQDDLINFKENILPKENKVAHKNKNLDIEFESFEINYNLNEIEKQVKINSLFNIEEQYKSLFNEENINHYPAIENNNELDMENFEERVLNNLFNEKQRQVTLKKNNISFTNNSNFDTYNYLSLEQNLSKSLQKTNNKEKYNNIQEIQLKEAKRLLFKKIKLDKISIEENFKLKKNNLLQVLKKDNNLKWFNAIKNNDASKLNSEERKVYDNYKNGDMEFLIKYLNYRPNFNYLNYFKGYSNKINNFIHNFIFQPIKEQQKFILKKPKLFVNVLHCLQHYKPHWINYLYNIYIDKNNTNEQTKILFLNILEELNSNKNIQQQKIQIMSHGNLEELKVLKNEISEELLPMYKKILQEKEEIKHNNYIIKKELFLKQIQEILKMEIDVSLNIEKIE